MRRPILAIVTLLLCTPLSIRAGGPLLVAGSGFDDEVKGRPLTWSNGNVQYFTDQGDLSPILNNSQADAFVADAFASWASIPGVALSPAQAAHLAEDVSSANVVGYPDGSYTIPVDIQPTALTTPVGIVYDYDGQVTEALLGYGAGGLDFCFTNAVYGGPDNFSTDGHLAHALVVINGVCAASSSQLPEVRYRLMRMLGSVLGLGWSQANLNVITGNPPPGPDDFQGFPLMHLLDPVGCVPISACYPGADIPKLDDRAALGRLYPANGGSQQRTARIHGSVFFTDAHGNPLQPMQGVNVVARRIDGGGPPSRSYVATSVSGFAFRGNAGNTINGFVDASGQHYDLFGSDDPAVEGAFDLGGLEFPDGAESAQFELSVEALDANWSQRVGPYSPFQVSPSGWFDPLIVTLQRGSDVAQDILMQQCQTARNHFGGSGTYANPANLPGGGGWGAWISGYGDADWFQFTAQANRSASVAVTAVDENGQPTQDKLLPVIGIWPLSDQSGDPAPAATRFAFNTSNLGMTRLDAQFNSSKTYRLGVADFRGDGRPDYSYVASVLYSDSVAPSRLSLAGGVVSLQGIGFHPGLQVSAGGNDAPVLTASANHLEVLVPQGSLDGTASIIVIDPDSGAFSQMTDALNYGASATDQLLLLQGAEPATAIGSPAANPIRLRAVAADGATPVSGATLVWTATLGAHLSACNGGTTCPTLSDEAGVVSTWVTPAATGQSTITAALAPASYIPPKSKQVTVVGTSSTLDLGAVAPTKWIGQGATLDVPLTVRVLSRGAPQSGAQLNFHVTNGAATLSAASGTTNGSGYATVTAHLANHMADVQVSACLPPNNTTCQTFTLFATPAALWTLEPVSGSVQSATPQNPFQPLILRVTDGSAAANPVMGVSVVFQTTLARVNPAEIVRNDGDTITGRAPMPVMLGTSQTQIITNEDGLASILPNAAGYAPCDVFIAAGAARATQQFHLEALMSLGEGVAPSLGRVRQSTASSGRRSLPSPTPPAPQYVWFGAAETIPQEEPSADSAAANCSGGDQKQTTTDVETPDRQSDSSPKNSKARCGTVASTDEEDQRSPAETGLKKLNIDVDKSANDRQRP